MVCADSDKAYNGLSFVVKDGAVVAGHVDAPAAGVFSVQEMVVEEGIGRVSGKQFGSFVEFLTNALLKTEILFLESRRKMDDHGSLFIKPLDRIVHIGKCGREFILSSLANIK